MSRNQNQGWIPLFFNDFLKDDWKAGVRSTVPAINIKETEQAYKVELAAAGMTKEDISVHINEDNNLIVSMERKTESKDDSKETRYLRREFTYPKFRQTMIIPENVNKEKIEAKVEHGVLSVHLPKLTEQDIQKKQRNIAIGFSASEQDVTS